MKASLEHDTHPSLLAPGSMLTDRLIVVKRIGSGGMGDVYEVEHKFTRHRRAAKVLHAQFRENTDMVERFLREASAAGRIGNPHIVETFDAGHLADGSPFIVMEFLDGKPLADVLRWNGRLDVALASAVMCQVCAAVQAAHAAAIIHRDLKPENLFLTERDGRAFVKVLDFGISKFQQDDGPEMRSTRSGITMGTPLYMAPEQLRGAKNADARSDVYSLGVILYEMLSGTAPFVADSFAELAVKVLTEEPRALHLFDGAMPQQMSQIVARAIHKEPGQRFQSARELADALTPFAKNCSVSVLLKHEVIPTSDAQKSNSDTHLSAPLPASSAPNAPQPKSPSFVGDTAAPAALRKIAEASPGPTAPLPASSAHAVPGPGNALRASELRAVHGGVRRWVLGAVVVVGVIGVGVVGAMQLARAPTKEAEPTLLAPAPLALPPPVVEQSATKVAPTPPDPAPSPAPIPPPAETPPVATVPVAPRPNPVAPPEPKAPPKNGGKATKVAPKSKAAEQFSPPPLPPPEAAPAPVAARQFGSVDLACVPVSCAVQVDGNVVGETPLLNFQLEIGNHTITFVNSETKASTRRSIEIKPGVRLKLPVAW